MVLDGALTTYTPSGLAGTSHTVKIQAIDYADNASEERIIRFPPNVEIIAPTVESRNQILDTTIRITGPAGMKISSISVE